MNTHSDRPEIKVLGWTDEVLDCDVCGLPLDRERTLAFTIDDGGVQYAGTTCAAKVGRTTVSKIRTAAKQAEEAARQKAWNEQADRYRAAERAELEARTGRVLSNLRQHNEAKDAVWSTFDGYQDIKAFTACVSARLDA